MMGLPKIDAEAPSGQLSLAQRWQITLSALGQRLAGGGRRRAGGQRPPAALADLQNPRLWQAIEPPRGRLAERALQLAQAQQPPWLLNHGLRTYAWGQALAVLGDLQPDGECLFAASVLHDAGLTPAAAQPPDHCFAVRGARYARAALADAGPPPAVHRVAQAIARHLDLQVPLADGVEAHLLQAGASVDVMGRGLARLPSPLRDRVLQAHPRLQMKNELCRCLRHEAQNAPRSRMGLYVRRLGLVDLVQRAPFDE